MPRRLPFFWIALAAGLAIRLVIWTSTSTVGTPIVDEQQYVQIAGNIGDGHGFAWGPDQPTSIRPPLYPGFLAATWKLAGERNLQAVRLLQIVMSLLTIVVVYQLGRRTFDDRVGRIAAAAVWLYPSLVFFNSTILTETLFTLLLSTFVLLTVMLIKRPAIVTAIACGAALGLATLTRSALWPLPIVLCPLVAVLSTGDFRRRVAIAAMVAVGYTVVIAPWAIRNTRLQGRLTIVDTMGGMNLRQGNYEHTLEDRMWDTVSLKGEKNWAYAIRDHTGPPIVTEGDKDKWAQRKAIEYIVAHPATTLRRSLIKFADFWGLEREYIAGVQQGLYHPPRWLAALVAASMNLAYVAIALTAAAAIWVAPPGWRVHVMMLLPVAAIVGVHMIVFGHSRYHVPLIPILAVYAASLATNGREAFRRAQPLVKIGALASVALLVGVWIRQILLVDAEKLSSLIDRFTR